MLFHATASDIIVKNMIKHNKNFTKHKGNDATVHKFVLITYSFTYMLAFH